MSIPSPRAHRNTHLRALFLCQGRRHQPMCLTAQELHHIVGHCRIEVDRNKVLLVAVKAGYYRLILISHRLAHERVALERQYFARAKFRILLGYLAQCGKHLATYHVAKPTPLCLVILFAAIEALQIPIQLTVIVHTKLLSTCVCLILPLHTINVHAPESTRRQYAIQKPITSHSPINSKKTLCVVICFLV